jgi:hypothetical protein
VVEPCSNPQINFDEIDNLVEKYSKGKKLVKIHGSTTFLTEETTTESEEALSSHGTTSYTTPKPVYRRHLDPHNGALMMVNEHHNYEGNPHTFSGAIHATYGKCTPSETPSYEVETLMSTSIHETDSSKTIKS